VVCGVATVASEDKTGAGFYDGHKKASLKPWRPEAFAVKSLVLYHPLTDARRQLGIN
jgi:hypothetical protein